MIKWPITFWRICCAGDSLPQHRREWRWMGWLGGCAAAEVDGFEDYAGRAVFALCVWRALKS